MTNLCASIFPLFGTFRKCASAMLPYKKQISTKWKIHIKTRFAVFNNDNSTPQRNVQYRPATSFLEIKSEKQVQQLFCVQEKLSDDN